MITGSETIFDTRKKPWEGLGMSVADAPTSAQALRLAGLDWHVSQEPIMTEDNQIIPGYKANVRDTDRKILGVVTDRYKCVQNTEAFSFVDNLLGEGVRFETAGSLNGGKRIWLLARLPKEYIISGERISPYLIFTNTFDASGAVKVAITPIRCACNNSLNLCLASAKRSFSMVHTGDIKVKIKEAHDTLFMADDYMEQLGKEFEVLRAKKLSDEQVESYIKLLLPSDETDSPQQVKNIMR